MAKNVLYISTFILLTLIPIITFKDKGGQEIKNENRLYSSRPSITKNSTINTDINVDFENWINDNIGVRSQIVNAYKNIQFYLFNNLEPDYYEGPNGEYNYATPDMLSDYQHTNLYSDEYCQSLCDSYEQLNKYIKSTGAKLFYYQCWDKHSIYPEYFPAGVIQHGNYSKTDILVDKLSSCTSLNVISPKDTLISNKMNHSSFDKWGDSTHWNQRGAYIGYQLLLDSINNETNSNYKVLSESDYDIETKEDRPIYDKPVLRGITETFNIKEVSAIIHNDMLTGYPSDPRHKYYINEKSDNEDKILIIGDSYFNFFIVDDIAESFHDTLLIYNDYIDQIDAIIDQYQPDIVVIEFAERVDYSNRVIALFNQS